jgi:glyoxylase-like metal-dependent hydrolase (beta-lactamase superfamily II)
VPLDWQGPDGNTVVLDAPRGLIVFDTGRSPMHAQAILDYAKARHRPIAAIVNSHWHLDHTTGNYDIRQVYPHTEVYASTAIAGALVGFLNKGRAQGDKMLADPKTSAGEKAQLLRGRYRIDHPDTLRPTIPVTKSALMSVAGRRLDVRLAKFAATEGDVWIYDPKTHIAIVGDLVVGLVPFMDTACADGWSKALGQIAAVPFKTLIPGHGEPMDRAEFLTWRKAYDEFVACGRSSADKKQCVEGWMRGAAKFIDKQHVDYARDAAGYYLDTRLRSSSEEQQKYCKPLTAS